MSDLSTLQEVLASTRVLFSAAACSCALTSADGSALTFVASDGAGATEIVGVSIPVNKGIAGWVAMSGQPTAIADVTRDDRFARDVAEATKYLPTSIVAVPFVDSNGDVLGVLEVLDPQRDDESRIGAQRGTSAELAVLAVLASQITAVLELTEELNALRRTLDPELATLLAALPPDQVPLVRGMLAAVVEHATPNE
jgi:signal transduction protein with GAF and PtsI domain